MKVVILAGGLGTRISEETDRIPKPMIEIGGSPILWHIMKIYSHHGFDDFIVCLGYRGYVIKEYFSNYRLHMSDVEFDMRTGTMKVHQNVAEPWRVTLTETGTNTMTGGRLKRVASYLNETFCFTYGDGLSDIDISDLVRFHRSHGKLATVTAITPPGRFGVLSLDRDRVTGFAEKVDSKKAPINGGFFVLEPGVADYIEGDETIWEHGPMERLAADGQLMAYSHGGFWQPMDTLREKRLLENLWASGNAPWKKWA
ncbi:MAG: glucose-1-phosphate cytidylyltransferase [Alphaproteobacteria bacterium]